MKTRTLLLLSVGVGLMILLAGGVLLLQLANESAAVEPAEVGDVVRVGDVEVTVLGAAETATLFSVEVEVGGVDDDLSGFSLATGDRRLQPVTADADGRCTEITAGRAALSDRVRHERRRWLESGPRTAPGRPATQLGAPNTMISSAPG